jgi:predicted nucleic acid-binding protein
MRYVVLDTDVASRAIKGTLSDPLAARLTDMAWCVTFVTVGELWQWATTRSWGPRTREDLERWLGRVVVLNSDDATSRTWGRISVEARQRGRPRPANDSWIAACCLAHQFPLATFNAKDFQDFAEHAPAHHACWPPTHRTATRPRPPRPPVSVGARGAFR